jgi:hypothetical protein
MGRVSAPRHLVCEEAEMKPMHCWLYILASLLLLAGGCARRAQHTTRPTNVARQTTGPRNVARQGDLPSWAPEHPSLEFLRAAKLLKAIPPEAQPYSPEYVPCWELFGSLTDKQIAELMTPKYASHSMRFPSKEDADALVRSGDARVEGDHMVIAVRCVSVPIASFSPRQRQLLDKYAAVYTGTNQGPGKHDLLVDLYHAGAEQDLSNVDLFFNGHGHLVMMTFTGHGKPFPFIGAGSFAQLREWKAPLPREKLRAETGRAK